jgi:large subunit ribosomal protein L20
MRARNMPASRERRRRILKRARGFYGSRSKLIRMAYGAVAKAEAFMFVGRKQKKRQYRRLWTIRLNAALRQRGWNYSQFIHACNQAGITLDRKVMADMAATDPAAFTALVEKIRPTAAAQA